MLLNADFSTMHEVHRFSTAVAITFFCLSITTLLAGADGPPPVGFLWWVGLVLLGAESVRRRIPTYLLWAQNEKSRRWLLCMRDGAFMGLVMAVMAMLMPGTGEPSAPLPQPIDRVIWILVLMAVGMVCSAAVYMTAAVRTVCKTGL